MADFRVRKTLRWFVCYFRYKVLDSGSIEISYVRTADSGMFQCFATNDAGEVNAATWLKILSKSFMQS